MIAGREHRHLIEKVTDPVRSLGQEDPATLDQWGDKLCSQLFTFPGYLHGLNGQARIIVEILNQGPAGSLIFDEDKVGGKLVGEVLHRPEEIRKLPSVSELMN